MLSLIRSMEESYFSPSKRGGYAWALSKPFWKV